MKASGYLAVGLKQIVVTFVYRKKMNGIHFYKQYSTTYIIWAYILYLLVQKYNGV